MYLSEYVLVMTVNPGFAGQKYLDFTDYKIEKLSAFKEKYGFEMVVDLSLIHIYSRRESLFIEIHGGKSPKPIFRRGSCALCPEASCEAAGETHEILPGRQRPWEKERKS